MPKIEINHDWLVTDIRFYAHKNEWEVCVLRDDYWYKATGPTQEAAFTLLHERISAGISLSQLKKQTYSIEVRRRTKPLPDLDLDLDL